MFEGFELATIDTGEATLRVRHGGSGPPLLLLHGHPQTHAMWHLVAPRLAQDFTVVAPDLRGYARALAARCVDLLLERRRLEPVEVGAARRAHLARVGAERGRVGPGGRRPHGGRPCACCTTRSSVR